MTNLSLAIPVLAITTCVSTASATRAQKLVPRMYELAQLDEVQGSKQKLQVPAPNRDEIRALQDEIRRTVMPRAWARKGVSIKCAGTTLVVTQSAEVHAAIHHYLALPKSARRRLATRGLAEPLSERLRALRARVARCVRDPRHEKAELEKALDEMLRIERGVRTLEARVDTQRTREALLATTVGPGVFSKSPMTLRQVVDALNARPSEGPALAWSRDALALARKRKLRFTLPTDRGLRLRRVLALLRAQSGDLLAHDVRGAVVFLRAAEPRMEKPAKR